MFLLSTQFHVHSCLPWIPTRTRCSSSSSSINKNSRYLLFIFNLTCWHGVFDLLFHTSDELGLLYFEWVCCHLNHFCLWFLLIYFTGGLCPFTTVASSLHHYIHMVIDHTSHCLIQSNFHQLIWIYFWPETNGLIDENRVGGWEVDFHRSAFKSNSSTSKHVPESSSGKFISTEKNNHSSQVRNVWKFLNKCTKSLML